MNPTNLRTGLALALAATSLVACAPMGMNAAPGPASLSASAGVNAQPATLERASFALRDKTWPLIGFQELEGKPRELAEFKGKNVLLVFYAYWCGHCQVELPRLEKAIAARQPSNFVCVPIEASLGTPEQAREFAVTYKVTMPLYVDQTGEAYRAYNVRAFPTMFLLSSDGLVKDTFTGELPVDQYARFITP